MLEARVEKFNTEVGPSKGIKINLTTEIDNPSTVFDTMVKSGNVPDIWSASESNMQKYEDQGLLMDLNTVSQLKDLVAEYKPYDSEGRTSHNGKVYALALEILPIKLAYNKDLFKAAGIVDDKGEAKAPTTWDEVIADAKKITDAGNGTSYGFGYSFGGWNWGVHRLLFAPWIASTGTGWFNNTTLKYDFEAFRPALNYMMSLAKDKSYFPGIETIDIDPIRAQFSDGKVGMEISPAYDIAVFNDQFPATCDWDIAEVPVQDPNNRYKGVQIFRGAYSMWSGVTADKLDAVSEVFKYLSADEFYEDLYANCKIIPANTELMSKVSKTADKTGWKNMSANADQYVNSPRFPDGQLTLEGDDMETVVNDMVAGNISVDDVIKQLTDTYQSALDTAVKDGKVKLDEYKLADDYYKWTK